jgi:hypothetical protein
MTEERSRGAPSEEELFIALRKLKGKAMAEELMSHFKSQGFAFDKTKTWDRLVILSRKGILKNDSGVWALSDYHRGSQS